MREIRYEFQNLGGYITQNDTVFGADSQLVLLVPPHNFSLAVSGEVLRETAFDGCRIVVSEHGEAVFYDNDEKVMAHSQPTDAKFTAVKLLWQQGSVGVAFGKMAEIDHYPHCDGEHDRYSKQWQTEHSVVLDLTDKSLKE